MAWKALCKIKGLDFLKTPVTFSDLCVFRPTLLTKAVRLGIRVLPEGGKFEVTEGGAVVFSGTVTLAEEGEPFFYHQLAKPFKLGSQSDEIVLQPEDVYKELRLRGYEYGANFRGIHSVGNEGSEGLLRWTGNWVTFLDTLLQLSIAAGEREDSLRLPVRLRYLRIDPQRHLNSLRLNGDIRLVEAHIGSDVGGILAGGVELAGLIAQTAQRRVHPPNLFLEVFEFVPYENNECFKKDTQFKNDIRRSIHATEVGLAKGLESLPEELSSELACWEQVQSRHIPFLRTSGEEPSPLIMEALSSLAEEGLEGPWRTLLRTAALSEKVWLAAWHQRNLKLLLDIVTENTPTHSLHCLALGKDIDAVVAAAAGFQSSNPLTETAWTIGTPQDRPEDAQVHDAVSEELDLDTQPTLPDSTKPFHVIVANRVLSRKSDSDTGAYLEQLKSYMAEGGFLLMHEMSGSPDAVCLVDMLTEPATKTQYHSHEEWLNLFQEAGLVVAAWQRDEVLPSVLYLLRKVPAPEAMANPRLISVDDVEEFSWLADVQADLAETRSSGRLWLTSRRRDNGLVGLGNCFREEMVKLSGRWPPPRTLADIGLGEEGAAPEWTEELVTRIGRKDLLHNLYRDGVFGSMRTFIVQEGEDHKRVITEHAYMANLIIGDLSSLSWVQNPNAHFKPYKQNGRELIDIHYAALNFRDIMLATGRLSKDAIPGKFADPDCVLGSEFSGVSRFNGRRVMGIAAGQALATTFVSDPHMTFDVPDKWSLAEAATTAVAYMTVIYGLLIRGRLRKGERLLVHSGSGGVGQAAINVALHHECEVFTTVSTDEKRDFLLKTFPQLQADHIFNSRSTEFELHVMTATTGKGLNVVLNSLSEDKLQASVRCLARHGRFLEIGKFDLANNSTLGLEVFLKNIEFHGILLDSIDDPADWSLLKHYFMEGVDSGMVKPIPSTIFPSTKVEEAFRYMAQGKHIGKVLIQLRENPKMAFSPKVTAVGRPHCAPGHSYLITGGLGGFGLQLAAYLVRKGAQKLILTSRSGIRSPYQARVIHSLRQAGVDVRISPLDVSDINQCRELLDECARKGPIGGIFHLAMVLRDSLFENQNVTNFKESGGIKYLGTQNLDVGSREVCGRELRWFVCFSSVSSGRGNSGQTAYGWANSAMERVCEARQKAGLPGTAIQWGAIGDVGVIVETMGSNASVVGGTLPQRMPSCLAVLDNFLSWSAPVVSSFVRADTRRRSAVPGADIVATIARIIGLTDPSTLNPNTPLADLGLDSLMGMEIKQAVERDANVVLSMKEIQTLTITKLKVLMSEGPSSSAKRNTEDTVQDLDQLREQMQKIFKLRLDVNDCKATESVRRINGVSYGEPVFFLHTMEGIASPLETLSELVTSPAFCLQCTEATPLDSIQAMAGHYLSEAQRVRKELGAETNPMRLVGYSYGACLAFEMALALEAAGEPSPTIVLIDSSHQYMAAYRNLYRAVYKLAEEESLVENAEFETELVSQMATRFASFNYAELRAQVRGAEDWAGRVEAATTAVMAGGLLLEPETFRWLAASVKGRYLAADKYEPSGNLKGSLTLIRATQGPAKESEVAGDYGLSHIVEGELSLRGLKVEVVKVVGDHEGLAQKNAGETAAVLNRLFS